MKQYELFLEISSFCQKMKLCNSKKNFFNVLAVTKLKQ